ncbi:MAG: acyl--CoA ligase, partial [Deltaproteobacteria bacterium]|nr:acyl--CoA ligase [Deltaproteobacteria bacterium]
MTEQTKKDIPFQNIFEAFADAASTFGKRTAVIYIGAAFSYEQVVKFAENFASSLKRHGVEEGDHVIMYIPNSLQWVVSWLGILRAGARAVPITPIYTVHDLQYIANDSGAKYIVCADANYGYVKQAFPETQLKKAVIIRLTNLLPWWKKVFGWAFDRVPRGKLERDDKALLFEGMVKGGNQGKDLPELKKDENDIAEILYTGGTTKFPKGVPITHGLYLESALEQIDISRPLFPHVDNVVIGSVPMFHILGQTTALSTLLVGGAIALMPKINLDAIFDVIERHKGKTLIGVPTLYRMILEHDRLDQYDLSSLKYCFNGGDLLPV